MIPLILNYFAAFAIAVVLTAVLVAIFLIFNAIGKSIMNESSLNKDSDLDDDTDDPWLNEDND